MKKNFLKDEIKIKDFIKASGFHGHLKDCDKDFFRKKVQNYQ